MFEKNFISYINFLLVGYIILLVISIMILAHVPPVSKDALVHHLAVPKLYLKHGGLLELASMPFSYFPMNLDLLYLIPLYFGNDIIPKYIHFAFALLTSGLIYNYLRARLKITYALIGVVLFLSIPVIVKLSITVYVDLGLIFFSFASLLLILKWIETPERLGVLVLSGAMCGLALGTKYNGLITLFLLTLLVPFLCARYCRLQKNSFFKPVGFSAIFLVVALLVFSPWMIRNTYWKSNPFYPLYNTWFNPPEVSQDRGKFHNSSKKSKRGFFAYRNVVYGESVLHISLLPVRIFFQGKDGDPQYFDGKLSPFLLILPGMAFLRRGREEKEISRDKKVMLAFSVLFLGFALFSTDLRARYIAPIIPPLIILSVYGVRNIIEFFKWQNGKLLPRIGVILSFLLLLLFIGQNTLYLVSQYKYVTPFSYLKGTLNRDEYISKYRPEYPTMQFINKHLPEDSLIQFLFQGKRGYYCQRDYILGKGKFYRIVRSSNSAKEILNGLKYNGITHFLIYYPLFNRSIKDTFNDEKRKLLKKFFLKHNKILFIQNGFGISALCNGAYDCANAEH